jgi:hypothetical protein
MTLTEQELKDLQDIIMEFPTKYGVQIIQYFNKLSQDHQLAEQQSKQQEGVPPEAE